MRKLIIFLALSAAAFGQVLTTNPANTAFKPTPANPYYPALAGLRLVIAAGSFVSPSTNATVTIAQQTLFLPDNSTNYVYLLPSSGVVTSNTSSFPSSSYPIAIASTSGGQIGTLQDVRPDVPSAGLPSGLNYVAPTLTVSTAGAGNAVLALSGNTSGTATFTAPAIAGTSSNGITMSNVLLGPNGSSTAASYAFSGDTQSGLYSNGSGQPSLAAGGTALVIFSTSHIDISTLTPLGWGAFNTLDVGISRTAPAVLSFGNGAQADETALIRDANSCRVTADITLPVNTATTVCTWSLPAVAKAWAWQCQIPWAITAGTGTNTLAIIANPSQTPTAATNGSAEIKTTNANAATEATTAISASGATTLLTSGTITPNAATFMSSTSGTLLASATAGTFAIQMTAAGTTATAAAKAGATCYLY